MEGFLHPQFAHLDQALWNIMGLRSRMTNWNLVDNAESPTQKHNDLQRDTL
jgi:hypothetical protein